MKQKIKFYDAKKRKPSLSEIEKRIKQYYVTVIDAPFDFLNKMLSNFRMYQWKIYVGNMVLPICPDTYFDNIDYIRQNYTVVRHIFMEKQNESPKGWVTIE